MRVSLFTRADCDLCEQAESDLAALQESIPHELQIIDIDRDTGLRELYGERVPVVKVGPYTLESPFSRAQLEVTLRAARDGKPSTSSPIDRKRKRGVQLNRGLLFFARHWLAIFNLIAFVYVALPFAAPTLLRVGAEKPARVIYTIYSPLCHQLAFRSWFLYGEQPAYPRAAANTGLTPYGEATGLDESDWLQARAFVGNERVGYKVAICERDVGIYGTIFLGGLAFALLRRRLKPIPIWVWVIVGVVPIALDGGTQFLAGLPLLNFPVRESTPLLRTITGALFGIMNIWLAYPYVEESMQETRDLILTKLARAGEI